MPEAQTLTTPQEIEPHLTTEALHSLRRIVEKTAGTPRPILKIGMQSGFTSSWITRVLTHLNDIRLLIGIMPPDEEDPGRPERVETHFRRRGAWGRVAILHLEPLVAFRCLSSFSIAVLSSRTLSRVDIDRTLDHLQLVASQGSLIWAHRTSREMDQALRDRSWKRWSLSESTQGSHIIYCRK